MKMYRLALFSLVALLQVGLYAGLVPKTMTAAELWNPYTWYFPYGIASAQAWQQYLTQAQEATNQLYQHVQGVSNPLPSTLNGAAQQPQNPTTSAPNTSSPPSSAATQSAATTPASEPTEAPPTY